MNAQTAVAGRIDGWARQPYTQSTIPLEPLRLALRMRKAGWAKRTCVYTTHPYTGAGCSNPGRWKAHGGPLFSPWSPGYIGDVIDRVKSRGRAEVLRVFGKGVRQLQAELREGRPS